MGSNGPAEQGPEVDNDDVIVLVTGFGPFKAQYPINPAWEIANALPPLLTPHPSPLQDKSSTAHPSRPRQIRILVYPSPVRVSYSVVRELVPKLWKSVPRIDFMVHIGMAAGREFYSVERRGHRDGYRMGDVDGKPCIDEKPGRGLDGDGQAGQEWIWKGCPEEIETDVAVDDVCKRWKAALPRVDVRVSEDAGRYLCDFIYYSSLAELWKADEKRRVVFFHVPVASSPPAVELGKEITEQLIRALVASRDMENAKKIDQQVST